MNNDEFEQLRREINESVLTEDLEQHHELYADDINVPIEEAWDQPAMGRDMGMGYGRDHDHMGMAHGRDMAYGRDHDHMGMAYKADDGSEFPDLNKDGEITQADILMGKGVIDKPASARDVAYNRESGDYGDRISQERRAEELTGEPQTSIAPMTGPSGQTDPATGQVLRTHTYDKGKYFMSPQTRGGGQLGPGSDLKGGMPPGGMAGDVGDVSGRRSRVSPIGEIPEFTPSRDVAYGRDHDDMGMAHGRDMGMAYKGDAMTWEQMTGDPVYNRDPDDSNMWESKSATVRGWIIENFKPLRSDGYDPERIVSVLNERAEDELTPVMLRWFHENKRQLQKDGYDFDLVVDKLNED
jgi:hypothetical protein